MKSIIIDYREKEVPPHCVFCARAYIARGLETNMGEFALKNENGHIWLHTWVQGSNLSGV